MKKAIRYMSWFVAGQAAQVVLNTVATGAYMRRPILFCIAAGFLLTVAVGAGAWVAKEEKPLSYLDYAEGKHEL